MTSYGEAQKSVMDSAFQISIVVIACCNLVLLLRSRRYERRWDGIKRLILDENLSFFFDHVRIVGELLEGLNKDASLENKTTLHKEFQNRFSLILFEFIDLFLSIDKNLHEKLCNTHDRCLDEITVHIFDEGLNLTDKDKFNATIRRPIRDYRITIVSLIFNFNKIQQKVCWLKKVFGRGQRK